MEYRRLGHSGLQVSVIGLGTNNFGPRLDYAAAEQCRLLRATGVEGFHSYTLNRAKLTLAICHILR